MPTRSEGRKRERKRYDDEEREEKREKVQGWGAVAKRQKDVARKKEELANQCFSFYLKEDETATIQFLQDEPYCFDAHSVKDRNGRFAVVPCQLSNQKHCVLCSDGAKQTWRAGFKIIDYRGKWDKDKKKFLYDKPIEKLWVVTATVANQLKALTDKRKCPLSEMVIEVDRSGSDKNTTYNFSIARDDDDEKITPIRFKEEYDSAEELCQPLDDEALEDYIV